MNSEDDDGDYKRTLYKLQVELVKLQRELIAGNARVLVIVEGRDAAGKDGTIKRLTAHMSPRETRVFAPAKPTRREESEWYFQRFVPHFPAGGEFVIFNRSWYNRAGVERVMGFCSEDDVETFFHHVGNFETMLVQSGVQLRKYYLDISRREQKERLAERRKNPLTQWKISPIDKKALKMWDAYTEARDEMFRRSSCPAVPWKIVVADHKKPARLAFIRDLLSSFDYPKKDKRLLAHDGIVFPWSEAARKKGLLSA